MGSPGVMEDDPQGRPPPGGDGRDPETHPDTGIAVPSPVGALVGGEDHERAGGGGEDVGAALRPGALLEQYELAPLEVDPGAVENREDLKREEHLAVEILVKRVPVAGPVAQDQWRGTGLA